MIDLKNYNNNTLFFDSIRNVPSATQPDPEMHLKYQWDQGRLYYGFGRCNITEMRNVGLFERILRISVIALITIHSVGLVWISRDFNSFAKKFVAKQKAYDLSKDIYVKKTLVFDGNFKLKIHLDDAYYQKLWNCEVDPYAFKKIHDEIIPFHHVPPLIIPHPFPDVLSVPSMEGLSLLANYLSKKNNLSNLYVCKNLEAFKNQLIELNNKDDFKIAFVVPTFNYSTAKRGSDMVQHLVPIFLEKKAGDLKICIMCSSGFCPINPKNIDSNSTRFNESEQIVSYIKEANLSKISLYFPKVKRQHGNGCYVFALKDAVAYLKDTHFWDNLPSEKQSLKGFSQLSIITRLPEAFMRVTQSLRTLQKYLNQMNSISSKRLAEIVKKHTLKHTLLNSKKKAVNAFIDQRVLKYRQLLLLLLGTQSDAMINQMISEKLIK